MLQSASKRRRVASLPSQVEEKLCVHPFARWLFEQAHQHRSARHVARDVGGAIWLQAAKFSSEVGVQHNVAGDECGKMTEDSARIILDGFAQHPVWGSKACEIVRRRCVEELQRAPPFPFSVWLEERRANGAKAKKCFKVLCLSCQSEKTSEEERWADLWRLAKQESAWDIIAESAARSASANPLRQMPPRDVIQTVAGVEQAAKLIRNSQRIVVLIGAGVSASCGIPTFRDSDGLYNAVAREFGLSSSYTVNDINYFRQDPKPWFKMVQAIVPSASHPRSPSPTHQFLRSLEVHGKLLHLFSQNIDTLELQAGIENLTFCHGSFATATCMKCGRHQLGDDVNQAIADGSVPYCQDVLCGGVMKPDVVLFGEPIPPVVDERILQYAESLDLLLVIGTSLSVAPCAFLPSLVGSCGEVPRILINMEQVGRDYDFEGFLKGPCDETIAELLKHLRWKLSASTSR